MIQSTWVGRFGWGALLLSMGAAFADGEEGEQVERTDGENAQIEFLRQQRSENAVQPQREYLQEVRRQRAFYCDSSPLIQRILRSALIGYPEFDCPDSE